MQSIGLTYRTVTNKTKDFCMISSLKCMEGAEQPKRGFTLQQTNYIQMYDGITK